MDGGEGQAAQSRLPSTISMMLMAERIFLCSDVPFLHSTVPVLGDPPHRQHIESPKPSPRKEFPSP